MNRNRLRPNVLGRGMDSVAAALGIHAGHADPFWTVPIGGLRNNDGGTGSGGGGGAGGTGGTGSGGTGSGGTGSGGTGGTGSGGTGSGGQGGQGGQNNGGQNGGQGGQNGGQGGTKTVADMTAEERADHYKKLAEGALTPEEVKRLQDSAAELEKIRDGQRTDSEKLEARATKAEARVAEIEPRLLRLEVALAKGLSEATAMRLTGATKAALEADADAFIKEYGTPAQQAAEAQKNGQRDARRQQDGGVRGTGNESKGTVASGADLYNNRRKKTTATA